MSQMERGILKSLGGLVRPLILCSIHGTPMSQPPLTYAVRITPITPFPCVVQ